MSEYTNIIAALRKKLGPILLEEILKLQETQTLPEGALAPGSPEQTIAEAIAAATTLQVDRLRPLNNLGTLAGAAARIKILLIGDSLTERAGGSAYFDYFAPAMRNAFGDGGTGYVPFALAAAGLPNLVFNKTSGVAYLDGLTTGTTPGIYNINGRGLYAAAGSGSDFFTWNPARNWTSVRIYYLIKPGGGTFTYRFGDNGTGTRITVNTDGTLGIGTIDINADYNTNGGLSFELITGSVAFFGADYILANGVAISNLGAGGSKLQQWAALDSTFRRAWFAALAPDLIIFNLGMNDRLTRTSAQFQTDLNTFFDDLLAASPSTKVILVRPNAPSDDATSHLPEYEVVLQSTAAARLYGYVSDKATLGNYSVAVAAGKMTDAIHPNAAGNKDRSQSYQSALGIPIIAKPFTVPAYAQTGAGSPSAYTGSLTTKYMGTVAKGASVDLYSLGLKNPFRTVSFRIRVAIQRSTGAGVTIREFWFLVNGNSTNNQAASVSPASGAGDLKLKVLAGDANDQDLTFTAAISSNRAVITATLSGGASVANLIVSVLGDFLVHGDLTGVTGQIVFES